MMDFAIFIPIVLFICVVMAIKVIVDAKVRKQIAEALALIDKAVRHRRPGPYQVQAAIAAIHARP